MKKIVALLLVFVMVLSMDVYGANDSGTDKPEDSNTASATESTAEETEKVGEVEKAEAVENDEFTYTFTQYGNARIKIVGAEATKNDKGEDLLRVYYDYTNTDDTANGHIPSLVLDFLSITQDGEECRTFDFTYYDEDALPEDLNKNRSIQPGCTNRNTLNIIWNPNGGAVKVSCFVMVGGWMYNEDSVETFDFEIDPNNLMGVPEPFVLPTITNPTYTSGMSASGEWDYPLNSEISLNDIELTKDVKGKDVVRVNFTVTNNDEEESAPVSMTSLELYQDGVSLPHAMFERMEDEDVTASYEVYSHYQVAPGETVECCALFYPRTDSPVEAVIENPNSYKCLGTCFDLKPLYDAAEAKAKAEADAAKAEAEAASAADKATLEDMVGVWDLTGDWPDRITFNADLTGVYDFAGYLDPFTYIVKDGVLRLTYDDSGDEIDYEISVNGDNLVLNDTIFQEEQTFVRADN
ncbi:MAG: DUF5067 domain-containing protein [Lachnospiraceae bacterium]|nr:DUF5067 domain-containing protein [Lachnospiraceae bacterium]